MNSGLTLTQDGNVGKDEYVESNNDSIIVTFQFNQLHDKSRRLIEDGLYTDTDIFLDTGSTLSVFKGDNMLLNIRAS